MIFKLTGQVTISTFTEVEADSLEEAIYNVKNRGMCDVHIDSCYSEEDCWMIDELDGYPYNIKQETED